MRVDIKLNLETGADKVNASQGMMKESRDIKNSHGKPRKYVRGAFKGGSLCGPADLKPNNLPQYMARPGLATKHPKQSYPISFDDIFDPVNLSSVQNQSSL